MYVQQSNSLLGTLSHVAEKLTIPFGFATMLVGGLAAGEWIAADHAHNVVERLEDTGGPASVIETQRAYAERANDIASYTTVITLGNTLLIGAAVAARTWRRRMTAEQSTQ